MKYLIVTILLLTLTYCENKKDESENNKPNIIEEWFEIERSN